MSKRRVVVTGLGAVTPIGNNVEDFWAGIREGKVGIGPITKFDTTDYKVKIAAEVKDFNAKDHMDPRAARRMDPFCQYAVTAAKEAFEAGYTVGFARTLHDIDEKEDISKFRNRMRKTPELQKSETGRYLLKKQKISIIVPIYNEESTIKSLQKQLIPLLDKCEILFVDGGSKDRTLSMIDSRFRVLHSEKGRANQMNLGAKESSGDILFFLQIFLVFHIQKLLV